MLDQVQYTNNHSLIQFQSCIHTIKPLYKAFISKNFRRRRNVNHSKLTDVEVIALLCLQALLGINARLRFYHFILDNGVISPNRMPEESRFNRICNRDGVILQIIRWQLIIRYVYPKYSIIDSLPMPLCKYVRNTRATLLNRYANIGFKSTKKMYYYGFKGSFEVSDSGIVLAYTITKASIHDIKMVKTLVDEFPCQHILADEGYISKALKADLAKHGIWFWTPLRSNMKQYSYDDSLLRRLRRHIETVFSRLNQLFHIEHNTGRSLNGFQTRLEQALLVDTLLKLKILN
ncbi:IS982 family transposase [Acetilactobacillus jinshanensis]|uniref:IS982 family transposase n=1 Tax=Acetilactobacillus jinshanensis TaxID=1720083 RepID=A0A4P6ZK22_9LACO|nr:IS982 family transposase [Acetilactobacillus jinshanensis]QBP18111.1 IS982 family transposase [Acetilactobacillus jinshanensis]URL60972.1 IS982 family transposase [uncultured bacterium]